MSGNLDDIVNYKGIYQRYMSKYQTEIYLLGFNWLYIDYYSVYLRPSQNIV